MLRASRLRALRAVSGVKIEKGEKGGKGGSYSDDFGVKNGTLSPENNYFWDFYS
jgi:hypothetical protein